MKNLLVVFLLSVLSYMNQPNYLYQFDSSTLKDWKIVNDGVMGGLSKGMIEMNKDGNAIFKGNVSLENNGGFTSIRHAIDEDLSNKKKIILHLKGDGKRYQFRLKRSRSEYHSYIQYFNTSGKWEEISLDLEDFYPSFRGRKLDMDNYEAGDLEEMSILIANYKAEDFELELDYIKAE